MKRIRIIPLAALTIAIAACSGKQEGKVQHQLDSLSQIILLQQNEMNDMTSTLDVVANCMDSIHQQEKIIYTGIDEVTGKKLTRADIRSRIKNLEALIRRQRERILFLEDSLSTNEDKRIAGLKTIIASLNRQLEEKKQTIANLEEKVRTQNSSIKRLTADVESLTIGNSQLSEHIQMQEQALTVQDDIINEGYYIIGTRKELKEAGVITVNLLQQSKLNLETADLSKMEKIDIRSFSDEITINSKKVKILSHMPEQSYSLVPQGNTVKLFIKDPAIFWSMSKILVIQKK